MCKVKSLDSSVKFYTFTVEQTADTSPLYYVKATATLSAGLPLQSSCQAPPAASHWQAVKLG